VTSAPATADTALLQTQSIEVRRGGAVALRDVTIRLNRGEVLAVLGPNGAGKSTLVEAIGDVLPLAAGTIERNGRVATALQSPDLAHRSVRANVELALAWWGVPWRERRARADEALRVLRVDHLADRLATSLSGGERRRVHLARAVATRPDILLLDEPFAGLDPVQRAALLDDAASAIRAGAGSVVVVVHDRAEAWALADRVVVLLEGEVVADGRPREVLDHPPSARAARFLGFSCEIREGDTVLLARPGQILADPSGDRVGVVTRLVPTEDGVRAEVESIAGRVLMLYPHPGPRVGDEVRYRIEGGARYPADD
jgi:ABC-type nitrate/sulfonate/bicarbonate transport system ATPase subunit